MWRLSLCCTAQIFLVLFHQSKNLKTHFKVMIRSSIQNLMSLVAAIREQCSIRKLRAFRWSQASHSWPKRAQGISLDHLSCCSLLGRSLVCHGRRTTILTSQSYQSTLRLDQEPITYPLYLTIQKLRTRCQAWSITPTLLLVQELLNLCLYLKNIRSISSMFSVHPQATTLQ